VADQEVEGRVRTAAGSFWGLTAARARGRVGGRPAKLTAEQVRQARRMYDARELTVEQIGAVLGVSRTSIYRALGKGTRPAPSAAATRPRRPRQPGARCGAANLVRCPLLASACLGWAALTGVVLGLLSGWSGLQLGEQFGGAPGRVDQQPAKGAERSVRIHR